MATRLKVCGLFAIGLFVGMMGFVVLMGALPLSQGETTKDISSAGIAVGVVTMLYGSWLLNQTWHLTDLDSIPLLRQFAIEYNVIDPPAKSQNPRRKIWVVLALVSTIWVAIAGLYVADYFILQGLMMIICSIYLLGAIAHLAGLHIPVVRMMFVCTDITT